jgi:hypothetical protein
MALPPCRTRSRPTAANNLALDAAATRVALAAPQPRRPPFSLYLEYAPRGSLAGLVERRRAAARGGPTALGPWFSDEEVRWLAARLLAALAAVHGQVRCAACKRGRVGPYGPEGSWTAAQRPL